MMANKNFDMDGLSIDGIASPDPGTADDLRPSGASFMDGIGGTGDLGTQTDYDPFSSSKGASFTDFDDISVPEISDMSDPPLGRNSAQTASRSTGAASSGMSDLYGGTVSGSSASSAVSTSSAPRASYGSTSSAGTGTYGSASSSGYGNPSGGYRNSPSGLSPEQFYANNPTDVSKDYENGRTIVMIIALVYAFFNFIGFLSDVTLTNALYLAVELGFAFAIFKGVRWARRWFVIGNYLNAIRVFVGISALKGLAQMADVELGAGVYIVLVLAAIVDIAAATLIFVDRRVNVYFEHC